MEMEDKKLKRFLQEELNREADLIMEEVEMTQREKKKK